MVSKESNHSLAQCNNTSKEKAMTVRSVLLNRDSPDIESRLKRRRNRTQQVRFKDQVDSADEHLEKNNTNSQTAKSALYKKTASLASVDTEWREATPTENTSSLGRAPCQARRRHWYQSRPCSLTLPNPKKVSMSTAIQTSPSLQKHFPAFRFRSKSVSDFEEEELMVALASHREKKQLAARNYMQLSGCNGETTNFRTLNGGDQVEKDSCLQNSHQSTFTPALQVSDRHPRRKQVFSPYPQLSLARGLPEEQSSQSVPENGTHHKQITHKEFVSNSPEYHHPFYPTNVASLDFGKKSVPAPLMDAASPPQQTPPVKVGEPELPTIQSPQGRLCEEPSDCVKDPKSESIDASETSASLQNELPSSLSYNYPQNTPSKKTVNCNRPLPSTQTSQDTEHRGSTPPHETLHTSPRTLGVLSPLDHKSATRCSSRQIIDVDCLTPSKKQEETLPTKSSTSLLANPATFRKEYTEIPDTSAIVDKSCLLNVKEDPGQLEQREGRAVIMDSNTKLLSGISEKDYSILDPQQEELCVPSPSLQSGDQTDPFNSSLQSQTQDPLDEYYIVRTRETPPEPTAVESRYPVPVVEPCLPADQSETLRQVQGLLELVAAAKSQVDLSKGEEGRLSQGRLERVGRLPVDREAGPKQKGDVSARLQALEGVLETSQQTIKVLLDVIQDLEKKEAQRDGRHSYRTGQDIENCGTCRDCACIIYR